MPLFSRSTPPENPHPSSPPSQLSPSPSPSSEAPPILQPTPSPQLTQAKRLRRQQGLFFGGAAFVLFSAVVTRRALTRRNNALASAAAAAANAQPARSTNAAMHMQHAKIRNTPGGAHGNASAMPVQAGEAGAAETADAAQAAREAFTNSGPVMAVEALFLATMNVFSLAMMGTGGLLWYFDIASMDDLRRKVRGGMGVDGTGRSEQEVEEELEEWLASVLRRKEDKERRRERGDLDGGYRDEKGRRRRLDFEGDERSDRERGEGMLGGGFWKGWWSSGDGK